MPNMNLTSMYKKYLSYINYEDKYLFFCDTPDFKYYCTKETVIDPNDTIPSIHINLIELPIVIKQEILPLEISYERMHAFENFKSTSLKVNFIKDILLTIHNQITSSFPTNKQAVLFLKSIHLKQYTVISNYRTFLNCDYNTDKSLHHDLTVTNSKNRTY